MQFLQTGFLKVFDEPIDHGRYGVQLNIFIDLKRYVVLKSTFLQIFLQFKRFIRLNSKMNKKIHQCTDYLFSILLFLEYCPLILHKFFFSITTYLLGIYNPNTIEKVHLQNANQLSF